MNRIFSVVNVVLIFLIGGLVTDLVTTWTHPKYPPRVDGTRVPAKSQPPFRATLNHPPYGPEIIAPVIQTNLFRKERTDYQPRPVQVARAAPKPSVPPPELKLKGVVLLNGTKIAILEGNYPVLGTDNSVKKKPIKRKGYSLGSHIGNYRLTEIDKSAVTLQNPVGNRVHLKLANRPPDQMIQRKGDTLFQKSKSFNPKSIVPDRPQKTPPPVSAPPAQKPKSAPPARISGAATKPKNKNLSPLHISGR